VSGNEKMIAWLNKQMTAMQLAGGGGGGQRGGGGAAPMPPTPGSGNPSPAHAQAGAYGMISAYGGKPAVWSPPAAWVPGQYAAAAQVRGGSGGGDGSRALPEAVRSYTSGMDSCWHPGTGAAFAAGVKGGDSPEYVSAAAAAAAAAATAARYAAAPQLSTPVAQ
jgi:hypothetical protein